MKKKCITIFAFIVLILTISNTSQAVPTIVEHIDGPQDQLYVPRNVHELGNSPLFPDEELIESYDEGYTDHIPCPELDNPEIPNVVVSITNLTNASWAELWYVGDPQTYLTNHDGWVNGELAFKIDNIGLNTPLLFESMSSNLIFEPGETWLFAIQDYINMFGLPPSLFGSTGVGFSNIGDQLSSGSIIAVPIPAPGTIFLVSIGTGFIGWFRRKRTLYLENSTLF